MNAKKGLRFATGKYLDEPITELDAHYVRVMNEEGRTMFEIRCGEDGHSIHIRGVDDCKVGKRRYSCRLNIIPEVSNCVEVSTIAYEERT